MTSSARSPPSPAASAAAWPWPSWPSASDNVLLLDEPTNHLDIPSQEILQYVLAEYQGTILLVSHDRYLIDALGTQIWEIDPDHQYLHVFKGTYSEYRLAQETARLAAEQERAERSGA